SGHTPTYPNECWCLVPMTFNNSGNLMFSLPSTTTNTPLALAIVVPILCNLHWYMVFLYVPGLLGKSDQYHHQPVHLSCTGMWFLFTQAFVLASE
ncbi:MAG: hypothetical protein MPK62_13125, partial [Alphaproteobacteria bacterium]|nr:hypothetical protein [Alphaproteobacteria bacterium]